MKELICINCPMGCRMTVDDSDPNNLVVSGNCCNRGAKYAATEVISPKRTVTASVRVDGGNLPLVSVKTRSPIDKSLIFQCLEQLRQCHVSAPVAIGDVILPDVCGTGVAVVATKQIDKV